MDNESKHGHTLTWNSEKWKKEFYSGVNRNYRDMRKAVYEHTVAIVRDGGYKLSDGTQVTIEYKDEYDKKTGRLYMQSGTVFYKEFFYASFKKSDKHTVITVIPDDCLDTAHKWVEEGLPVCVLNMANRQNPGGGVIVGAGAQEEYLFRCSDYYRSLYMFADFGKEYGVMRDKENSYPLDRNYGGIYTPGVTIFRENEKNGYALTDKPWKVNMIAVAAMRSPRLEIINGEEMIHHSLIDGAKNKLRTIFRIAADNGQRYLVLGAIGCGAFQNPPKHIARLFRDVLCESEFSGAFDRICFAVKEDHNSNGDSNYTAFRDILNGFVPPLDNS